MTVRGSAESVEARLGSGRLACWCGGVLRPWGHGPARRVITFAVLVRVQRQAWDLPGLRPVARAGAGVWFASMWLGPLNVGSVTALVCCPPRGLDA